MDKKEFSKRAKEIISKIIYITIATVDRDRQPWNSPVYSAYDETYNFFWTSWKENIHSQNIRENNKVFLVIYDSTVPEGTGEGVYIKAKAYELTDKEEIKRALKYLYERKNKNPRRAEEFLENYPRRVYKAVPERVWMNAEGEIDGNYVDKRIEVELISGDL